MVVWFSSRVSACARMALGRAIYPIRTRIKGLRAGFSSPIQSVFQCRFSISAQIWEGTRALSQFVLTVVRSQTIARVFGNWFVSCLSLGLLCPRVKCVAGASRRGVELLLAKCATVRHGGEEQGSRLPPSPGGGWVKGHNRLLVEKKASPPVFQASSVGLVVAVGPVRALHMGR